MKTFENGCPACGGTIAHAPGCKGDDNRYLSRLVCDECGEPIDRNITVMESPEGTYICEYCLDELTPKELAKRMGCRILTAGEVAP